jgi:uncharacterized protein (TIGR00730 family)
MRRVCVFCGAASGAGPGFVELAAGLGRAIAARGLGLVYGGASIGMMGALADAALGAGGQVIGVIPRMLVDREIAHAGLSELHVVESMHARKARMVELSGAFVALPGGFGTLDELFEVTTWAQLGLHQKPIGVLDAGGWFSSLVAHVDRAVDSRLMTPATRALWTVAPDPEALLEALASRAGHSSTAASRVPSTSA